MVRLYEEGTKKFLGSTSVKTEPNYVAGDWLIHQTIQYVIRSILKNYSLNGELYEISVRVRAIGEVEEFQCNL